MNRIQICESGFIRWLSSLRKTAEPEDIAAQQPAYHLYGRLHQPAAYTDRYGCKHTCIYGVQALQL